jgi:AcrR family transcriptional regulator
MTDNLTKPDERQAKERLLDAAEQLFASKGFADVSIRELAATADVNVAAVNYHFQGKENLFKEVIVRRFSAQRDRTLGGLQALLQQSAGRPQVSEVIQVWVREYLDGALSNSFLTMITREMHSGKSGDHVAFFKEMVAPIFAAISSALIAARPHLHQDDLNWIIASIVGQIHHFILRRITCEACGDHPETREFMFKAFPALALSQPEYVAQVANHITRFSTAAIDGLYPEEN